jgi:hypothetical protein
VLMLIHRHPLIAKRISGDYSKVRDAVHYQFMTFTAALAGPRP